MAHTLDEVNTSVTATFGKMDALIATVDAIHDLVVALKAAQGTFTPEQQVVVDALFDASEAEGAKVDAEEAKVEGDVTPAPAA